MTQVGRSHTQADIQGALERIVADMDFTKSRLEALAQWAQMQTADDLAAEWGIPAEEATATLAACMSFGAIITHALAADALLALSMVRYRNLTR